MTITDVLTFAALVVGVAFLIHYTGKTEGTAKNVAGWIVGLVMAALAAAGGWLQSLIGG